VSVPGRTASPARGSFAVPLLLLLAAACSDEPAATAGEPSIFASGADQVMLGVEHYLTRDGIRRGVLHADTAFTYEDASRIELRNLEIEFFDEAGTERGLLSSERGTYLLETGDMTVQGSVELEGRLQAGGRSVLETDSLAYDAAANQLATDGRWTLTRPDGTVERGRGLVTDPALQHVQREEWSLTRPGLEVPE